MTSGIDSDLLAELKSHPINNFVVFEFDFGGSTLRYSEAWATASAGLYEGRVIAASDVQRAISDAGFTLLNDTASVTIRDDIARTLEKIIMGSAAGTITGSAVRTKLASKTLASSKWFTLYSGIVQSFSSPSPYNWTFGLTRDDRALQGLVKIPSIQSYDWPNAPAASLGVAASVVYGKHLSVATAVTGMVPTIYVDDVLFQYVASFGRCAAVPAVYSAGTLMTLTTDYTIDLSFFRNGKYWTIVDFIADQGTNEITVDINGLTLVVPGGPPLLDNGVVINPATQLEHFLTNFVFGDWSSSTTFANVAWLFAADFQINESFFLEVEDFLLGKQVDRGSRVISGDRKGIDVLNEWCAQFQIPCFWTYDGKIAIRPDDHTLINTYIDTPWLRQDASPERESVSVSFDATRLLDEVRVDYLYSHADSDFQDSTSAKDTSKGHDRSESFQLNWRESVV